MPNELALLKDTAIDINKAFGFEGKAKPSIPIFKINGSDDEDGVTAPRGTYVYEDGDRILYASECVMRVFTKAYQYRLWDKDDKNKNDQSIIANSFKAEFRSASGRIACGRLSRKEYEAIGEMNFTAQQKYYKDNVKCKLLIYGVITGTFTNVETKEEVILDNELCAWAVPQSGFMIIDQAITGIQKERRKIPLTPIKMKLKKEKKGSLTYYTPLPEVTPDTAPLVVERDSKYLMKIKDLIQAVNNSVMEKFNASFKQETLDASFTEVKGETMPDDPLDDI